MIHLIEGEWVVGEAHGANPTPKNLADARGWYSQGDAAQVDATAAFPAEATGSVQTRSDALDKIGIEIPGPRGRQDEVEGAGEACQSPLTPHVRA